jgi:hypothetical protein
MTTWTMMSEAELMQELRELEEAGVLRLIDTTTTKDPTRPVVTVVGNQRSDREDEAYDFVSSVIRKYPRMKLVVGDTSNLEKAAALAAEHQDIEWTVITKGEKGEWDEGPDIRNERVVSAATQIVAFDRSARTKAYEVLAKRQMKPVHHV